MPGKVDSLVPAPTAGTAPFPLARTDTGETASGALRFRLRLRWWTLPAAACLGVLAIGIASCGGGSDDNGGAGEGLVLLVRESSGDLFAVEGRAEVERDDRVLEGFVTTTPITVTRSGQPEMATVAALGDRRVIVADGAKGASVLVLGGEEPEILLSADALSLNATVAGGVLYVRETRGSSQRCHRGNADGLERVYRGDYCRIADSGHILGGTQTPAGVHEVVVLDPDGDELINASFDARPEISSDGRYLITTDRAGVTVARAGDGEAVWELPDGTAAEAAAAGGRLAVAALDRDGRAVLVVLSGDGDPQQLESLDTGDVRAGFVPGGDLYWTADSSVWTNRKGSTDIEELGVSDDLRAFDGHDSGAITAIVDDFGVRVDRHASGKDPETLHEIDGTGIAYWLISGDYLYIATPTIASIVPLDGGDPYNSERWDDITVLYARNGTLVAAGSDSGDQTLFALTNGNITEYDEHDRVHSAQIHGGDLYATVTDDNTTTTIVYNTKTGEQHTEPEHHNYTLAPNTSQHHYTTITATADYTPAAPQSTTQSSSQQMSTPTTAPPETTTPPTTTEGGAAAAERAAAVAEAEAAAAAGWDLLDTVLARGYLRCGVSTAFSETAVDGTQIGFDADYCRAVAAALSGDANAVVFMPLTEREWSTAVETGEIDVLMRNSSEDPPIVSTYWQNQSQSRFHKVVEDTMYALLDAWQWGINSANADATAVRDLLNRDASISLAPDALLQVIKQVGNYEEIGSRHGLW